MSWFVTAILVVCGIALGVLLLAAGLFAVAAHAVGIASETEPSEE